MILQYLLVNLRLARRPSAELNRRYMVDALGSMRNSAAQDILVDYILKSPIVDVNLVDSVLVHAVGKETSTSKVLQSMIHIFLIFYYNKMKFRGPICQVLALVWYYEISHNVYCLFFAVFT